jgi:hypothetical protein
MSQFLDTLRQRLVDSQRVLQDKAQVLQKAQLEHQLAAQEHASWANAVATETRREQQLAAQVPPMIGPQPEASKPADLLVPQLPHLPETEATSEPNKSLLIRNVLQRHPSGIRPIAVWHELRNQVPRPYIYSVLSRMKQKKQVRETKGKYFLIQASPKQLLENSSGNGGIN